jgi:thymidylate synthase
MEIITSTSNEFLTQLEISSVSNSVKSLLQKIDSHGLESAPRGQRVREVFNHTLEFDPRFPLMDFESRKFNSRYFAGEIAWYLMRERDPAFINNFSSFWKNITNPDGTINSNYGDILFSDQLLWAYNSLKRDINTRQAIAFVNQPKYQIEGNKDFVCTMYLNFWVRENRLHMKVQMRSNDIFYGLSYDAPFFATIQQQMYHWLKTDHPELQLGTYYHCADNIHYYERHFDLADRILQEDHRESFVFLKKPLLNIVNGTFEISEHAQEYINNLKNLINKNEHTNENCRKLLEKLYFIQ